MSDHSVSVRQHVHENFVYVGERIDGLDSNDLCRLANISRATWASWQQPDDAEHKSKKPWPSTIRNALEALIKAFPKKNSITEIKPEDFYWAPDRFANKYNETFFAEEDKNFNNLFSILFNDYDVVKAEGRQEEIGENWRNLYMIFQYDPLKKSLFSEVLIVQGQDKVGVECLILTRRGSIYRGGLYANTNNAFALFGRYSKTVEFSSRSLNLALGTTRSGVKSITGAMLQSANATNKAVASAIVMVKIDQLCPSWQLSDLVPIEKAIRDQFRTKKNPIENPSDVLVSIRERFGEIDLEFEGDEVNVKGCDEPLPGDNFEAMSDEETAKFLKRRCERLNAVLETLNASSPMTFAVESDTETDTD